MNAYEVLKDREFALGTVFGKKVLLTAHPISLPNHNIDDFNNHLYSYEIDRDVDSDMNLIENGRVIRKRSCSKDLFYLQMFSKRLFKLDRNGLFKITEDEIEVHPTTNLTLEQYMQEEFEDVEKDDQKEIVYIEKRPTSRTAVTHEEWREILRDNPELRDHGPKFWLVSPTCEHMTKGIATLDKLTGISSRVCITRSILNWSCRNTPEYKEKTDEVMLHLNFCPECAAKVEYIGYLEGQNDKKNDC